MKQRFLLTLSTFILALVTLHGQDTTEPVKKLVIKPTLAMNFMATYTEGKQVFNSDRQEYDGVDNRLNFSLHRSRFGLKGSYGEQLIYNFTGSLDFVGRDVLAGSIGGANNGASPSFRIWNALVQYKVNPASEGLYLTFGYQCPQLSRESVTSPFVANSFEKSWSQNYIRRHTIGTGPGRIVGLNIGGLSKIETGKPLAVNYDVGIYNPPFNSLSGNSVGTQYSPLLVGRVAVHIGDPEFTKYSRGHKSNYKGERNGITLAVSGSHQGANDLWERNQSYGVDILANYEQFWLTGELMQLTRAFGDITTSANTGFLKMGYYTTLANGKGFEPVINYCFFTGPTEERAQEEAQALGAFLGTDNYFEFTVNYYLTSKTRLSVAYTLRDGDAGDLNAWTINNNYFQQGGVGPIQRGNYFGLGLLFTI